MRATNNSPSYATRRCPACTRTLPRGAFADIRAGELRGHYTRCVECRQGYSHAEGAEARAAFEAGAPMEYVDTLLCRTRKSTLALIAKLGWDRPKRKAARKANALTVAGRACCVRSCSYPAADGIGRCSRHERNRLAGRRARAELPPTPRRGSLFVVTSGGTVTIRCHQCHLPRVTSLANPDPCPRCGTSGAVPVGVWDEAAA